MSWFDATGFANLAKSALKEAQKTIDKALDIDEEEVGGRGRLDAGGGGAAVAGDEAEGFFSSWGVKAERRRRLPPSSSCPEVAAASRQEQPASASLWGSFTGSFFDNPTATAGDEGFGTGGTGDASSEITQQPKKACLSGTPSSTGDVSPWKRGKVSGECRDVATEAGLCDDASELGAEEGFSRSQLVVESEDGESEARPRLSSCEAEEDRSATATSPHADRRDLAAVRGDEGHASSEAPRRRDAATPSSCRYNRLSVISSESDKKSSESVEVLGSASSDCGSGFTTSPDSDVPANSPAGPRPSVVASSPDSVEVITDTLSSVEVLEDDASGRTSRMTSSPYVSPDEPPRPPGLLPVQVKGCAPDEHDATKATSSSADEISPESVEVIPEEEEDEEDASVADDSYTSASESTATVTAAAVLEPSPLPRSPLLRPLADPPSAESSLCSSSLSSRTDASPAPRCPQHGLSASESAVLPSEIPEDPARMHGRAGLQLPLGQDAPRTPRALRKCETSEGASRNPRVRSATDSSGEGTVLGSGSDDEVTSIVGGDARQSGSLYVRTMLADAMGDEDARDARQDQPSVPAGDQSPISSESRSDMLKVESEQTSEHTSGDELETTTSSDIEIISSPNGDSSSTHSRLSPAKLVPAVGKGRGVAAAEHSDSPTSGLLLRLAGPKAKGHQRELSETSSGGSEEEHSVEVKKLMRRIAEMTEIIEVRESRLIELSRINVELQESNSNIKRQLEAAGDRQDAQQVREDHTQRLSALERRCQQAARESEELRALCGEKDDLIRQLTAEGEKLSRKELGYCNRIKELKAREAEADGTARSLKAQLGSLGQEAERLKLALAAKEGAERRHTEAVDRLAAANRRQEKELARLRSQLEDAQARGAKLAEAAETARRELEESKETVSRREKELQEARLSAELSVRQEMLAALEDARSTAQSERDELDLEVKRLRVALSQAAEEHKSQESCLRRQCAEALQRLERAEARSEELAQAVSAATRPLVRQLESLRASSGAQLASWEQQERVLADTVDELQTKLNSVSEQERAWREQCASMSARVSGLESRLSSAVKEAAQYKLEIERLQVEMNQLKSSRDKEVSVADSLRRSAAEQVAELRREVTVLEQQLGVERAATEAEKRRTALLQDQLRERDVRESRDQPGQQGSPAFSQRSSPTLSFGRASLPESFSSIAWAQNSDDMFESGSTSGRLCNVYDSLRAGNTTSLLEGLQSQLKLRDGEVQQLQWELGRRDGERAALTAELAQLTARLQDQGEQLQGLSELREAHGDLQRKYDALLQMYGEKVEEAQELRLDLEDVKEAYKTQIDQLLKKEPLS
ncbi:TATA element modulatory factor-like [Bacillus rossius redtenbacheri]|uniref:TATA element modulatory factor-like n=1 Tax=Bacillus rossius redtenbacheri TaxID=93214 RepID=UPI002FDEFE78